MVVKGIGEKYLDKTGMTAEDISKEISYYIGENVNTINILSAGWDVMFGDYAVIRAGRNRLWIVSKGKVEPDNGWVNERGLY